MMKISLLMIFVNPHLKNKVYSAVVLSVCDVLTDIFGYLALQILYKFRCVVFVAF